MTDSHSHDFEFGDFYLDTIKRLLSRRDGKPVPLKPKVFDTLLYLLEQREEVLTKERLMKAIWPDTVVEENNLSQNISVLRKVLGETRGEHRYIVTVPGRGYRFVAGVRTKTAPAKQLSASPIRTIAVLPFKPLVAENREASLEMGMADTLIARLSGVNEMIVRPISSVRKYADLDQDPLLAGRELEVESVLEGSLQRWGDKIRVTVRLVRVSNGMSLWADTFDEKFNDIFDLQDTISAKIVSALALHISSEEQGRLTKRHTHSTEAYQCYLKGRYYWWKTGMEEFHKSRDYFLRAVDADPSYALGYCGLSGYYGYGSAWGMVPADEGWPEAEALILKALQLDDSLSEAHTGFAGIKMVFYRDWAGAEREARCAIELNPNFDETHYLYSFLLLVMGRFDEAITESRRALEIDPYSFRINTNLGTTFYFARRYHQAIEQYQHTLELDPDNASVHESLGDAYEQQGMFAEAAAEWHRAITLDGDDELAEVLLRTNAKNGFTAALQAVLQIRLERLGERTAAGEYVPAIFFARAYARLDAREKALQWLYKACEERNVFALLIKNDPIYDRLRSDPLLVDLMRRMGL